MPITIKFVSICTRTCTKKTSLKSNKDQKIPRSPLRLKMAAPTRVVLLACGSFNPITNMHLRMFEIARDYLQRLGKYQVIGGLVSPVNDAYAKKDLISGKHRAEMCKLALQSSDWVKTSTWELERDCWTETAKVLKHFDSELNPCGDNQHDNGLPSVPRCTGTPQRRGVKRTSRRNVKNQDTASNEEADNDAYDINANQTRVQVKLLCGADLLESFAVPDLWAKEDMETIVGKHGLVVVTRSGSDPRKFIYESDMLYKYQNNIDIVTEWIYNDISSTKIRRAIKRNESIRYIVPDPVIKYIKSNELYQPENIIEVEKK
ncbi:nicotinamide/nicotinic acid mononucleotide adenylyltransferase 1-like isoform X2 [Amphiura filiformis]|uniref:nicotinamide/nicotinic acid mononucleotide adenylyltransferase 1-like isoform X2 n=1 Tax=Amphiura filiformis TaxID=82378 RepID=UPI003B2112E1